MFVCVCVFYEVCVWTWQLKLPLAHATKIVLRPWIRWILYIWVSVRWKSQLQIEILFAVIEKKRVPGCRFHSERRLARKICKRLACEDNTLLILETNRRLLNRDEKTARNKLSGLIHRYRYMVSMVSDPSIVSFLIGNRSWQTILTSLARNIDAWIFDFDF